MRHIHLWLLQPFFLLVAEVSNSVAGFVCTLCIHGAQGELEGGSRLVAAVQTGLSGNTSLVYLYQCMTNDTSLCAVVARSVHRVLKPICSTRFAKPCPCFRTAICHHIVQTISRSTWDLCLFEHQSLVPYSRGGIVVPHLDVIIQHHLARRLSYMHPFSI